MVIKMNDAATIFAIISAIATILAFIVVLYITERITRPIAEMTKTVRSFSKGEYDAKIKNITDDEIGELAGSFNKMADTVEDKIYELEKSAREKEDFVANFAHELKTPMTSVIGYADMIYQKDMSRAEIRDAAGYIVNEGMRLEALSLKLI